MGEYSSQSAWKRLLWKEYREGRLVVLFAVLAPLLLFRTALAYPDWSIWRPVLAFPAAAGVHLLLAFWGVGRGNSRRSGSEFAWTHLPTSPVTEWLASLVVPMVVIGAVGALYGWLASPAARPVDHFSMPLAGVLDLVTTFVICYFISMVISNWAAYLFGVFRLIGGTLISVWGLTPMVEADVIGFVSRTLIGTVLGSLVYVVLFAKRSVAFRQGTALLVLLVVLFGQYVPELARVPIPPPRALAQAYAAWRSGGDFASYLLFSSDRTVELRPAKPHRGGQMHMVYANQRTGFTRGRHFSLGKKFFYLGPRDRVYFAQMSKADRLAEVVEWDTHSDKLRTVARLPVKARQFDVFGALDNISPDGRYMILELKSALSNDTDLWLLDMDKATARLAIPDAGWRSSDRGVIWKNGSVAVWDARTGATLIDLKTLATRRISFEEVGSR